MACQFTEDLCLSAWKSVAYKNSWKGVTNLLGERCLSVTSALLGEKMLEQGCEKLKIH